MIQVFLHSVHAKTLFDIHEDPFILEQMGELWNELGSKNRKPPAFDTIQNFFISIAISFSSSVQTEENGVIYSEETQQTFIAVLDTLAPSDEKSELELVLDIAERDTEPLEFGDDADDFTPSAAEQLQFRNEFS